MPRIFRDSQVLPIWEGTSTVMSLDVLRSIQKSRGSTLKTLLGDIQQKIESASARQALEPAVVSLGGHLRSLGKFIKKSQMETADFQLKSARDFAFTLAKLYQAVLLLDHANFTGKSTDIYAANHFSGTQLNDLIHDYSAEAAKNEFDLVFANYSR